MSYIKLLAIGALIVALAGCSVSRAAKHRGASIEDIQACQTRTCFLSLRDVQVMSSTPIEDGGLSETYKCLLEQGSTGRAVMHGLLDVATLGLWELAGTPIEGSMNKDRYVIVTALFDEDGRTKRVTIGDQPTLEPVQDTSIPATAEDEPAPPSNSSSTDDLSSPEHDAETEGKPGGATSGNGLSSSAALSETEGKGFAGGHFGIAAALRASQ